MSYTKCIFGSLSIFMLASTFATNVYALDDLDSSNIKYNVIPPDGAIMIGLVSTKNDFEIIQNRAAAGTQITNVTATNESAFSIPSNVLGYINVNLKQLAPLPVSDTLLLDVWKTRQDLQSLFPEVKYGYLYNLKVWAKTTGWNEEPRLSALIPEGQIAGYASDFKILVILVLSILISISLGFIVGYFNVRKVNSQL